MLFTLVISNYSLPPPPPLHDSVTEYHLSINIYQSGRLRKSVMTFSPSFPSLRGFLLDVDVDARMQIHEQWLDGDQALTASSFLLNKGSLSLSLVQSLSLSNHS